MAATRADDLQVIIPSRDRWSMVARTLDALRHQTVSGFDTLVVADGTDQQPPHLGDARVVVKEHGGPGAARNYGVSQTERPLVLFLVSSSLFGSGNVGCPLVCGFYWKNTTPDGQLQE